MKKLGLIALLATVIASPVQAQTRVQEAPQPRTPGFQAPVLDPVMTRLNAMQLELNALRQSVGRQMVVLHFTPTELPGWLDNNYNNNQKRSADLCKEALGDRYGRVISYRIRVNGDRFFFSHVVCETQP